MGSNQFISSFFCLNIYSTGLKTFVNILIASE